MRPLVPAQLIPPTLAILIGGCDDPSRVRSLGACFVVMMTFATLKFARRRTRR